MAVIINEFEVVPDTGDTVEDPETGTGAPMEEGSRLTPMDLHDVLRFRFDRMLRTWAH